jgi:hypothetical protein
MANGNQFVIRRPSLPPGMFYVVVFFTPPIPRSGIGGGVLGGRWRRTCGEGEGNYGRSAPVYAMVAIIAAAGRLRTSRCAASDVRRPSVYSGTRRASRLRFPPDRAFPCPSPAPEFPKIRSHCSHPVELPIICHPAGRRQYRKKIGRNFICIIYFDLNCPAIPERKQKYFLSFIPTAASGDTGEKSMDNPDSQTSPGIIWTCSGMPER